MIHTILVLFLSLLVPLLAETPLEQLQGVATCLGKKMFETASESVIDDCKNVFCGQNTCAPSCAAIRKFVNSAVYGLNELKQFQEGQEKHFKQEISGTLIDSTQRIGKTGEYGDRTILCHAKGEIHGSVQRQQNQVVLKIGGTATIAGSFKITVHKDADYNKKANLRLHPISVPIQVGPFPIFFDVYLEADVHLEADAKSSIEGEIKTTLPFTFLDRKITLGVGVPPKMEPDIDQAHPVVSLNVDNVLEGQVVANIEAKPKFDIHAALQVELNGIKLQFKARAHADCTLSAGVSAAISTSLNFFGEPKIANQLAYMITPPTWAYFEGKCTFKAFHQVDLTMPKVTTPSAFFQRECDEMVNQVKGLLQNRPGAALEACLRNTRADLDSVCTKATEGLKENTLLKPFENMINAFNKNIAGVTTFVDQQLGSDAQLTFTNGHTAITPNHFGATRFREIHAHKIGGHHNHLLRSGGNPLQA